MICHRFHFAFLALFFICSTPLFTEFKPLEDREENIAPYLLGEKHPAKKDLDRVFGKRRVTLNKESLKKAKFTILKKKDRTGLFIVKHQKIPNYIIKLYIDKVEGSPEWKKLKSRVEGALITAETIKKHGWQNEFTVPKKWIYLLPETPSETQEPFKRKYILVSEEIPLMSKGANYARWFSPRISKSLLFKLSTIMQEVGLWDSSFPHNVPFGLDGRISFIDTEYHSIWPIHYGHLIKYLIPELGSYWKKINEDAASKK